MVLLALALAASQPARAQVFTYKQADLCLGLRKPVADADGNEVVVDIGQASNYVDLAIGSTISVPNLSVSQLAGSFVGYSSLQWSVLGYYIGGGAYAGYPNYTLWLSEARPSASVQSTTITREVYGSQKTMKPYIQDIFSGAQGISKAIVTSNQFNTPYFVQENITTVDNTYQQPTFLMDYWLNDTIIAGLADLQGNWDQNSLESTNPPSFTAGSDYLDLYEVRPLTDSSGNPIVDPHTGTSGPAYYLGYFQFTSGGSITFTRAASSATPPPPPPPVLSITVSGNNALISFASTNGATYTLYSTNSAGLTQPVSSWPSSPGTIAGDGTTKAFTVPLSKANSFYRVGAQ